MPQALDVFIGNAAKSKAVGDPIHMAPEPRKAVGKRAVEIEDDEGIGQGILHEARAEQGTYSKSTLRLLCEGRRNGLCFTPSARVRMLTKCRAP